MIIGLADACGVFERLLPSDEHEAVRERIALLARMDLIGRAVTEIIQYGGREAAAPSPPSRRPDKSFRFRLMGKRSARNG